MLRINWRYNIYQDPGLHSHTALLPHLLATSAPTLPIALDGSLLFFSSYPRMRTSQWGLLTYSSAKELPSDFSWLLSFCSFFPKTLERIFPGVLSGVCGNWEFLWNVLDTFTNTLMTLEASWLQCQGVIDGFWKKIDLLAVDFGGEKCMFQCQNVGPSAFVFFTPYPYVTHFCVISQLTNINLAVKLCNIGFFTQDLLSIMVKGYFTNTNFCTTSWAFRNKLMRIVVAKTKAYIYWLMEANPRSKIGAL